MVKHIAIIIARGGSKRIPRKNIIDFMGKPLMAWTIEAALASARFHRVVVSTDDEEIADTGRHYGAEVPFLRLENSDDNASSSAATLSCLRQAEEFHSETYQTVTQLMPNCPLRDANDIRNAFDRFESSENSFQLSCFEFGWMNPWWAIRQTEPGHFEKLFPEALQTRSQDLPRLYCPTGAVWIAQTEALKASGTYYGEPLGWFQLDWKSAVDIDDYADLEMAQAAWLVKNRKLVELSGS